MSTGRFLSQRVNCNFKSIKKLHRDILDLLNKSKTPSHCRFTLANLHFAESLDVVPYVASESILLKTLNFLGGSRRVHIFINNRGLWDKLH
jgi:hypothetical protein